MEESSTIQGQTVLEVLSILLLTLITVCACLSCRAFARRNKAACAKPADLRQPMLHSASFAEVGNFSPPSLARMLWEKHKSSIGDWMAPLIVWAVVIWTLLAVVIVLLGEG
jgi:hypothetical protein